MTTERNSAYDEAVRLGYAGTRTTWLAELETKKQSKWWRVLLRHVGFYIYSCIISYGLSYMWLNALNTIKQNYVVAGGDTVTFNMVVVMGACTLFTVYAVKRWIDLYREIYKK